MMPHPSVRGLLVVFLWLVFFNWRRSVEHFLYRILERGRRQDDRFAGPASGIRS